MNNMNLKSPFVFFILGPTASGKSDVAMECAQKLGAEIINADSIQVYDKLDIGSAKPTQEDLRNVPHHLIGHVPLGDHYTAGKFRRDVLAALEKRIQDGQKLFFIVGGSGFYLRALITGLYDIPEVSREIHEAVEKTPLHDLYEELVRSDPEVAKKLSPQDSYRVARAVEVFRATGAKLSEYEKKFELKAFPYPYKKIGLNTLKENLRKRVEARAQKMLAQGLLKETKSLVDLGYSKWPPLQSVGYREVQMLFKSEISQDELLPLITQSTMQLIKKQMTWFKKDLDIEWFDINEGFDKAKKRIIEIASSLR